MLNFPFTYFLYVSSGLTLEVFHLATAVSSCSKDIFFHFL